MNNFSYAYCCFVKDNLQLNVRLPCSGEYVMQLYSGKANSREKLNNFCNYVLQCDNKFVSGLPFPSLFDIALGVRNRSCIYGIKPSESRGVLKSEENFFSFKFKHNPDIAISMEITSNSSNNSQLKYMTNRSTQIRIEGYSFS